MKQRSHRYVEMTCAQVESSMEVGLQKKMRSENAIAVYSRRHGVHQFSEDFVRCISDTGARRVDTNPRDDSVV